MYFLELLLIALALGTDAFAVTLANGLAFSGENAGKRMAMPLYGGTGAQRQVSRIGQRDRHPAGTGGDLPSGKERREPCRDVPFQSRQATGRISETPSLL